MAVERTPIALLSARHPFIGRLDRARGELRQRDHRLVQIPAGIAHTQEDCVAEIPHTVERDRPHEVASHNDAPADQGLESCCVKRRR